MKRRSFLAALLAAPVLAKGTNVLPKEACPRFPMKSQAPERSYALGVRAAVGANIGVLSAGKLRSAGGRVLVDLGAGCITVS